MSSDAAIDAAEERAGLRNPGYEIFMGLLSILSLVNIVLFYLIDDQTMRSVITVMSFVLTAAFLIDFLYRLRIAPSKSQYMIRGYGWADMLASLPFPQTNWLRLFRLIKVYRLLKDYGIRNISRSLVKERAESALLMLLFVGILVLEFGSLALLALEGDNPDANITNASDALWYVIVTMSTVGYGDEYPITNPGRIVGAVIIIVGVGIFGTLTGYLANLFLTPARKSAQKMSDVQTHLAELKELAEKQQATISELATMLDERQK